MKPQPAIRQVAEHYRFGGRYRIVQGPMGDHVGRGTGASLEFEDRRNYVVGDDLRYLDWRAYARTDQHMVRVYREEVQPTLDVLLDGSRSMAVDPVKAQRAVDLAALLMQSAIHSGYDARLLVVEDRPRDLRGADVWDLDVTFSAVDSFVQLLSKQHLFLRRHGLRAVVSDFLAEEGVGTMLRHLGAGAQRLFLMQVLSTWETKPAVGESLRLIDAETEASLDLVMDEDTVSQYRQRLDRLRQDLVETATTIGGDVMAVDCGMSLAIQCQGQFCQRGLLEPR